MRTDSPSPFSAYALFFAVAFLMVAVGGFLQLLLPLAFSLMLSEVLCVLGPALAYQRAFPDTGWAPVFKSTPWPIGARPTVLMLTTTILIGLGANVLAALVVYFMPSLQERQAEYMIIMQQLLNPPELWKAMAGAIAITVFAPVCEEVLFRGTLLKVQLQHLPVALAIGLNGLLFGIIHFNEMSLVPLTIVGAFFAWLTWRSGSVWPAIASHAALNAVNGVILPRIIGFESVPDPILNDLLLGIGVLGALAASGFVLLRALMPAAAEQ
jgi:membrane protease YdiL (CAAX protease family)